MKKLLITLLFIQTATFASAQNSILWEISGNGLSNPSYLMGTLKFIAEKEFFLPKEAVSSIQKCKIFAIEDQVDHKAQMELNKALHFPKGKSLSTALSPEDYQKVLDFFQGQFKISRSQFEKELGRLIPLALSINMTRMSLGQAVKYYDIELLLLAKKYKLKTYSLESIQREAEAIQSFAIKDQVAALLHSIEYFPTQVTEYLSMEEAYIRGDLDAVFEYSLHPYENNQQFINDFYFARNLEWLPKINKMINDKPSFIAVGVSHLEGEKGLINLLKSKGYIVTPIAVSR